MSWEFVITIRIQTHSSLFDIASLFPRGKIPNEGNINSSQGVNYFCAYSYSKNSHNTFEIIMANGRGVEP